MSDTQPNLLPTLSIVLIAVLFVLLIILTLTLSACTAGEKTMFFTGKNAPLEHAINNDDPQAVADAIAAGANPNAVGLHGVTPIIMSSGRLKYNAMQALLKHNANPNAYDKNGDNAVTLATNYYKKDKKYLELLLDNGGDPSSLRPNKDPILTRFGNDRNLEGIRYLASKGANVDARSRTSEPLVKSYALTEDWDVVWTLIELGAKYDYTDPNDSLPIRFKNTTQHGPGGPMFDDKEKVWRLLCESGIEVPPLVTEETWEWYYEDGNEERPDNMPTFVCNLKTKQVEGEWGDLKPKVVSAYDMLKLRGEL
jgi:hypothetical protein